MSFQFDPDAIPNRRRGVLALAPLIDVTFILLIFFMLVTQFAHYSPLEMKVSALNSPALQQTNLQAAVASGSLKEKRMALKIRSDGTSVFEGREIKSADELHAVLAAQNLALGAVLQEKKDASLPVVLLEPESKVPLQNLIDVLAETQKHKNFQVKIVMPVVQADTQNKNIQDNKQIQDNKGPEVKPQTQTGGK